MNKIEWHTESRKISDLIPFHINPRKISEEQTKSLTASIEKFGFVEIPAINTDNTILAGHQIKSGQRYVNFCKENGRDWNVIKNGADISNDFDTA